MPIPTSKLTSAGGSLEAALRARAAEEGFDKVGIASLRNDTQLAERLDGFLAQGFHGDMDWMANTAARRSSPLNLWPEARSAIMLGLAYGDGSDPLEALTARTNGTVALYAQGGDYHDIMKSKLRRLAAWLAHAAGAEARIFVDTAPLMEKPLAAEAGLGWQGKHTNLLSRDLGSWFFLGALLTTAELEPDAPSEAHCGSCTRCLDVCPTRAFPAPHQLDARRCISYLTIEHKGHIPLEFREPMGNRIFGCDDCLAVCPWNKFAEAARETKLAARDSARNPPLEELLCLDDSAFRARFSGSPIKRTGRDRFLRNVLIAAGNSCDARFIPRIETLLGDTSPLVRAMAVWALSRLMSRQDFLALREREAKREPDPAVRSEWRSAP